MTLRELIFSVDAEEYADSQLFQELLKVKPEFGSNRSIGVKLVNGNVAVTNVHVGSLGDVITYRIDVDPVLKVTKIQLLDAILRELSTEGFDETEQSDFWTEMTNLQKAKIIR
ncbi:MAG: hypothetical protein IJJ98_05885 [Prevotella sp.]|nr:hypothetical protein [Prevotella sp.]MBQ6195568.1 hypothetical protein [Prevotella sp.]MBR0526209.1 hypothetical protein [Prevotella sp.]